MEKSPFVPESERADYVQPEFLGKVASLEPVEWMPKVQAKKFRLQQRSFERETPWPSKEKLQAAVPSGAEVVMYKTDAEFAQATGDDGKKSLDWIKRELKAVPPSTGDGAVSARNTN
jgi:hypothetical protein